MKAAVYRRFGGPDVVHVEQIADPEPNSNEILIRVHATTVSAADHRSRSRDIPAGLILPSSLVLGFFRPRRPVLGMDASGIVVKIGDDVQEFAPGDEVVAMLGSCFGGHAEYVIVKATDAVVRKPRNLAFDEAASLIFGGLTAQAYLNQATVQAGTTVLVNGASGAVGSAFVQIASAVGAHVTAVCSAANHELARDLGAQRAIDYHAQDFTANATTYDVIVDCVGNAPVRRVRDNLNPGGAVLLVAADLRSLISRQARRPAIRDHRHHRPRALSAADLEHVMYLGEVGDIRPVIDLLPVGGHRSSPSLRGRGPQARKRRHQCRRRRRDRHEDSGRRARHPAAVLRARGSGPCADLTPRSSTFMTSAGPTVAAPPASTH